MDPLTHNVERTCERLGFKSRQTFYNEVNSGRLRTYKVGRRRFASEEACVEYVRAREAEMQEAAA